MDINVLETDRIYNVDCLSLLKRMDDDSVDCCVTSPPYFALRDYGIDGQIGLEETPEKYIEKLTRVFAEVRRVMKPTGTLWLNIGDSYNNTAPGNKTPCGFSQNKPSYIKYEDKKMRHKRLIKDIKQKDLIGIPWMLAFSLRAEGWYLRQDIIWHKPNPMPESVTDRCTKSHEYIFLLSKSQKYYFDNESIKEESVIHKTSNHKFGDNKYGKNEDQHFQTYSGKELNPRTKNCKEKGQKPNTMHLRREAGLKDVEYIVRNKRDVWSVNIKPMKDAHFATYPVELIYPCILAGCPENGVVLDPFMGSGTTALATLRCGGNRHFIGSELNPEYVRIAENRIRPELLQMKLF